MDEWGGEKGINREKLEFCLAHPSQTFGSNEVYRTIEEKYAVLVHDIVTLHPFTDGNKRSGYYFGRVFLLTNGYDLESSEKESYEFFLALADGQLSYEQVLEWAIEHIFERIGPSGLT